MDIDIFLNKKAIIERCLHRIQEEYADNSKNLEDMTRQDSIVLNLQRACEAGIDLAMHVISARKMGIPQNSREAFQILAQHKLISRSLGTRLQNMVGFRNVAVHDYQSLDLDILSKILDLHLKDFQEFTADLQKLLPKK